MVQGLFSQTEAQHSINWLELRAIRLANPLPADVAQFAPFDANRQHDGKSIHKQTGRYPLQKPNVRGQPSPNMGRSAPKVLEG